MPKQQAVATPITCKTALFTIGSWTILRLPETASAKLPSRGQVMVEGTINGVAFKMPLEPDGKWSHWLHMDASLLKTTGAAAGDNVTVTLTPSKDWLEPPVPADIKRALANTPEVQTLWHDITPMARWEWVRWIRSTGSDETRQKRIGVALSKMKSGMRRPCCWNRNLCTEPSVSKSGVLLEPTVAV